MSLPVFLVLLVSNASAQQNCEALFRNNDSKTKAVPLLEAGEIPFSFSQMKLSDLESLQTIIPEARSQIQSFFKSLGVVHVFIGRSTYRMMNNFLFVRLTREILKNKECQHLICRDSQLNSELMAEIEAGRTVLFTHGFNGFVGAAFQDMARSFKPHPDFSDVDATKSVLIVSTRSIRSTIAHELKHGTDYETGMLQPMKALVMELFNSGELSAKGGRGINAFVAEIRAYTVESAWIKNNTRSEEFLVESSETQHDYSDVIRMETGAKFREQRLEEIGRKIDWYFIDLKRALNESTLSIESKRRLLDLLAKALEPNSPLTIEMIKAKL